MRCLQRRRAVDRGSVIYAFISCLTISPIIISLSLVFSRVLEDGLGFLWWDHVFKNQYFQLGAATVSQSSEPHQIQPCEACDVKEKNPTCCSDTLSCCPDDGKERPEMETLTTALAV